MACHQSIPVTARYPRQCKGGITRTAATGLPPPPRNSAAALGRIDSALGDRIMAVFETLGGVAIGTYCAAAEPTQEEVETFEKCCTARISLTSAMVR
jgi:hypothetical protein